ncbi:MAG: heme exporter protein CcmD [Proteobacteria bacterium]|nr:heme exporter protein CcmD [Pseudomonadota bacterium]
MVEFFNMDGYGVFIWPSYVIVFVVLIGLGIQSRKWLANLEKAVQDLQPEGDAESEGPQIGEP